MTPKQQKTLESMKDGHWYTARSLGTNELTMDRLMKLKAVRRRRGEMYAAGVFTLNVRWEYQAR